MIGGLLGANTPAFADQPAGTIGIGQWVTVTNTGDALVAISRVRVLEDDDASAGDFLLTTDRCTDETLAPGESRTLTLTFRSGARDVGEYTSALQAFEAASGAAVEVPLALTVTQGTDAEEGTAEPETASLSVYPNPSAGEAVVELTLSEASETRVVLFDVLGREVAVLHDGPLGTGSHRLALDGRRLPSGVYLVRVEGATSLSRRITLVP